MEVEEVPDGLRGIFEKEDQFLQSKLQTSKERYSLILNYFQDSVRCDVSEMWGRGDRVACGVITQGTIVVFRSTTAMVYLFIQMSSEMWDFDMYGDLYFEKAVNGFLYEMFSKWQKTGASHEVEILINL